MRLINVNPYDVWGFYPVRIVPYELIKKLSDCGWSDVPRVPIFSIPEEQAIGEEKFILLDGNKRMSTARALGLEMPSALYDYGEVVDVIRHGLEPFGHSADPNMYDRLLTAYIHREELISRLIGCVRLK